MGFFQRLFGRRQSSEYKTTQSTSSDRSIGHNMQSKVPRTWENLPSMAMLPLPSSFDFAVVNRMIITEAGGKDLICLVEYGWTASEVDALNQIELTWDFVDDPNLVAITFPNEDQIIVKASFLKSSVSQISASTFSNLAQEIRALAKSKGLHVKRTSE